MALLVFMGVLLIGGFLGQYISAFIPLGLGTISIGLYTFSIWGFVVTAIVTFPILIYAIRHSQNTERVLTHG